MSDCIICGKPIGEGKGFATGYAFYENGKNKVNDFIFCSMDCANKYSMDYVNPIFQNRKALDLFRRIHPKLSTLFGNKKILFLEEGKET